jgi:hypothetical protein
LFIAAAFSVAIEGTKNGAAEQKTQQKKRMKRAKRDL